MTDTWSPVQYDKFRRKREQPFVDLLAEYIRRLPEDLTDQFVDVYGTRLLPHLDSERPFFFPFPGILCWGQRPA